MTNIVIQEFEKESIQQLTEGKEIPEFKAGDTLSVGLKIVDGNNVRIQVFTGLCIARKNRGLGSSFTVRKISHGVGVERILPLYCPSISYIKVDKVGIVRRAKLYYIRKLRGKMARIKEKKQWMVNKKGK